MAVADVEHRDAAGEVHVAPAVRVPQFGVLRARGEDRNGGGHAAGDRGLAALLQAGVVGHGWAPVSRPDCGRVRGRCGARLPAPLGPDSRKPASQRWALSLAPAGGRRATMPLSPPETRHVRTASPELAGPVGAAQRRVRRALVSRCLRVRGAGRGAGGGLRDRLRRLAGGYRGRVRRGLLEPDSVHHADGVRGDRRLRGRDRAGGGAVHRPAGAGAHNRARRDLLRRPGEHAGLAAELGLLAGVRRPAGARAGAARRPADGLSRRRRLGVPRPWRGVGDGVVVLGRAAAGQPGEHAAGAGGDHRRAAVLRDDLPVAVDRADRDPDHRVARRRLVHRPDRRRRAHRARVHRRVRRAGAGTAAAHAPGRVARIQPAADRTAVAAGVRLAVWRVRQQAGGDRDRQPRPLQPAVPVAGPAAALAAAQLPRRGGAPARTGGEVTDGSGEQGPALPRSTRRGEGLEYSPLLTVLLALLAFGWLFGECASKPAVTAIANLDTYNLLFLSLGLLLHWRPRSFLDAVARAVPATTGVLIQFPLYGGIALILTHAAGRGGERSEEGRVGKACVSTCKSRW